MSSAVKNLRRERIRRGIRQKIRGVNGKLRLSIFKSNTTLYAQLIDDQSGKTLASASTRDTGAKSATISNSNEVGKKLAERAIAAGHTLVVFDRSGYAYHGKIKALAEGAREGGLIF